jgi:hypothetical protein
LQLRIAEVVSKLDVTVVVAALVSAIVWAERANDVTIDAPTPAEIALRDAAAACPNNDSMPYTARCLTFVGSKHTPDWGERISLAQSRIAASTSAEAVASGSECPDNDNRPYPPACIQFLSGWFWRVN